MLRTRVNLVLAIERIRSGDKERIETKEHAGKAGERRKIILEVSERRRRVKIVERHIQRDQIACFLLHG